VIIKLFLYHVISRRAQFQQWCAEQNCRNNGFLTLTHTSYSWDGSGCVVTRLWAGRQRNPAVIPGRRKRFFGSHECPYCARVENLFIYTSVSPFEFTAWYIIKHRGNFPFTFIPILARLYSFYYTQTILVCNNSNNNNNDDDDDDDDDDNNNNNKRLCIAIQQMWNLKCTIIPVIIGATGIVTRSLRKNLEAVPANHSIDSVQKTAILGTSHIIRKVLQCEA